MYLLEISRRNNFFIYIFFYLEIIELKCCNMNYNTRNKIDERSQIESLGIIFDNNDDEEDTQSDNITIINEKEMICMQETPNECNNNN